MEVFDVMMNSMNYVNENKDSIVQNGFGFMIRQDLVKSLKFSLSVARLHCVLDQSAYAAVKLVDENMTVVDNAGVNDRGVAMALLSYPPSLGLEAVFTIYSFMLAMKETSNFTNEDFYCVLVK